MEQDVKIFCQLKRLQPQRKVKHKSMRQTALNSSSNSLCCYICTYYCDQEEEEEDKSDSKKIVKVKLKAGCADFKTNTRSLCPNEDQKVYWKSGNVYIMKALIDAPGMVNGQMNFKRLTLTNTKSDSNSVPDKKGHVADLEATARFQHTYFIVFMDKWLTFLITISYNILQHVSTPILEMIKQARDEAVKPENKKRAH
ncbi:hypothetical protein LXL04_022640 [Taraxacum kok-saghyz]